MTILPSPIEQAAIDLHDHLWLNVGETADWPLHFSGDDEEVSRAILLLNNLQKAIRYSPFATHSYFTGEELDAP